MASTLIWSQRALEDLFAIIDWIDKSSSGYANAVADRIELRAENLRDQPRQGRAFPKMKRPAKSARFPLSLAADLRGVGTPHHDPRGHPGAMPIENALPL